MTNRFSPLDGDSWFSRNQSKLGAQDDDPVLTAIQAHGLFPKHVLEIGCANGWRLARLKDNLGCECWGCDISHQAVAANVDITNRVYWREAHHLDKIPTGGFDMVIYGFSLYLSDPKDLPKIVSEGDRVLANNGHLVVLDFLPDRPHSRIYQHNPHLRTRKCDYSQLWLAYPQYALVGQTIFAHEDGQEIDDDTRVAVTVLHKNLTSAFPLKSS